MTEKKEGIDPKVMTTLLENASVLRSEMLTKMFDPRRDIDVECGYPKSITTTQYKTLYKREGVAQRVVAVQPEDSWAMDPEVFENEDADRTPFEIEWEKLQECKNLYHYLHRIDELSGIGRYGILLLGFDGGEDLSAPVAEMVGGEMKRVGPEKKLLFVRAFDEASVTISSREHDQTNPRFGQPLMYKIKFQENSDSLSMAEEATIGAAPTTTKDYSVHWSRVIHVADNRAESEVYGTPRMEPVYNRLQDIRKVLSGSGEMFWKGAFPGYSFEMDPSVASEGASLDAASVRTEFENYSNGLQRYLALTGLTAKSLAPQVADPKSHIETQLRYIAISLSVPYRIFLGTEEAKLASSQDIITWNKRISRRQDKYLSPMLIRPFIDRMILMGVVPEPGSDGYQITWPDLNAPTDAAIAEVAKVRAEALSKYLGGGVDAIIPPEEFLTIVMGMERKEVEQIMEASATYIRETEDDEDVEIPEDE